MTPTIVVGLLTLGIGFALGMIAERGIGVRVGQLWMSLGNNERTSGLCVVARENDSRESPGSWVMRRLSDGKTLYMHRPARLQGKWLRIVRPVPGAEQWPPPRNTGSAAQEPKP